MAVRYIAAQAVMRMAGFIRAQSGGHHALAARIGKRQTVATRQQFVRHVQEVCPVDIDLPRMLLDLRHDLVEVGVTADRTWDWGIAGWKTVNKSPRLFELSGKAAAKGGGLRRRSCRPIRWLDDVSLLPSFAPKSFRQMWREEE